MSVPLLPLSNVKPTVLRIAAHGAFPNSNPSGLPVVHYKPFASAGPLNPSRIEEIVRKNGFKPAWRYGMYDFDHFHSTTHELLIPYAGRATIMLGGGQRLDIKAGDVLLLPAGVAHRAVSSEGGFTMVGSYPAGSKGWDTCYGGEANVEERIRQLGKGGVVMDPVYGKEEGSPVAQAWGLKDND